MNRDVFVIPADISREGAWGSNQLIRDGLGKLTTSADDILCEYEGLDVIQSNQLEIRSFDQPIQERIYQSLTEQPLLIDEISEKVSISSTSITMHLSLLEVK